MFCSRFEVELNGNDQVFSSKFVTVVKKKKKLFRCVGSETELNKLEVPWIERRCGARPGRRSRE